MDEYGTRTDLDDATLTREAHTAALRLFRKINRDGAESLSSNKQRVVSWAVRLLERRSISAFLSSSDTQTEGSDRVGS